MMDIRFVAILLTLTLLSGCVTPYQPMGFRGGYSDVMLDARSAQVVFAGNTHTSLNTVKNYLLLRCAEVTLRHKFSYFEVESTYSDTQHGVVNLPRPYPSKNGRWGYRDIEEDPPLALEPIYQNDKHSVSAIITMYKANNTRYRRYRYDARRLIANVVKPGLQTSHQRVAENRSTSNVSGQ